MFLRIDHIGVAVRDLAAASRTMEELLGLKVAAQEEVEEQQLIAALVPTANVRFELMQPTADDSVVGRFLERRGEGVHHICFEVEDIQAEIDALKARDVQLVQGAPREGFVGLVEFVHPRAAAGVLVEFAQVSRRTPTESHLGLGYVTIATWDAGAAARQWITNFRLAVQAASGDSAGGGRHTSMLESPRERGQALVEFVEPLEPGSTIGSFIETRGEGVYSVTLEASDMDAVPYVKNRPGSSLIGPEQLFGVRLSLARRERE